MTHFPRPSTRAPQSDAARPRRRLLRTLVSGLAAVTAVAATLSTAGAAHAGNRATPGNFTGFGFDQCLAPTTSAMDTWMQHSPFSAVGIYISGDSRGCRNQPNLTPSWVSHQLSEGWRLLPITLGPQAACSPHFPRYGDDETISDYPGRYGKYSRAREQGVAEANKTVNAAGNLGIAKNSVLWYDLEAFDIGNDTCRESALRFLSAWVTRVRNLGYQTGVYSSAASGILMLDNARKAKRKFAYPDYLWIARWDGVPNTKTTYISDYGWNPHRRVKQYKGGHNETWGGVTINIDSNWLDVGRGSIQPRNPQHCGGVQIDYWKYQALSPGEAWPAKTKALQCLLKEKGLYGGDVHGRYNDATVAAAKAWQQRKGLPISSTWNQRAWVTLLSAGASPVSKRGSHSLAVRRIQRALNAALDSPELKVTGVVNPATVKAIRIWQKRAGIRVSGVVNDRTWARLQG